MIEGGDRQAFNFTYKPHHQRLMCCWFCSADLADHGLTYMMADLTQ